MSFADDSRQARVETSFTACNAKRRRCPPDNDGFCYARNFSPHAQRPSILCFRTINLRLRAARALLRACDTTHSHPRTRPLLDTSNGSNARLEDEIHAANQRA
jgi:hypothetical protein